MMSIREGAERLEEVDVGADYSESEEGEAISASREVAVLGEADVLYEDDDSVDYGQRHADKGFGRWSAKFLRQELQTTLDHHQLVLVKTEQKNEKPEEISRRSLELAEQMQKEGRWPAGIGAKAALRLALRKMLFYGYCKNFELDGVPKHRAGRQSPSNDEQMERHTKLENARTAARENPQLRAAILALINQALTMQMLPEMFNRNAVNGVAAEQQNDLAVNFLFWAMESNTTFSKMQRVVIFLTLFKDVDKEQVVDDYMRAAKIDDGDRLRVEKEVDDAYQQTAGVFRKQGRKMIAEFLESAVFNGKDRTKNVGHIIANGRRNIAANYHKEVSELDYPTNYWDVLLRSGEIMMAKRGNLSARNTFAESLLRLIVFEAQKNVNEKNSTQENIANANLTVLGKIVFYDPRFGSVPSTYFCGWIKQSMQRRVQDDTIIRLPTHFSDARKKLASLRRQNPTLTDEQIEELFLTKNSIGNLYKIKRGLYGHATISLETPLAGGNHETGELTIGDQLQDQTDLAELHELLANAEVTEQLGLIVDTLPPMEAIILRARMGLYPEAEGKSTTLEQVGALFNISRERARQIESKITRGLCEDIGHYKVYCRVKDPKRWGEFCKEKGLSELEIEVMNMVNGWDKGTYYKVHNLANTQREFHLAKIKKELQKRHGVSLSSNKIYGIWKKVQPVISNDSRREALDIGGLEEVDSQTSYELIRQFIRELRGEYIQDGLLDLRVKKFFDGKPKALDIDWAALIDSVKDVKSSNKKKTDSAVDKVRKLSTSARTRLDDVAPGMLELGNNVD